MFFRQLRNEIWKLFAKRRTHIGFGIIIITQFVIAVVFRFTNARGQMVRTLEGNGYLAEQYISGLTIATVMLFPMAYVLLPLYVSLVGGDTVAKEAEDGTLRMILSRPISRTRLLFLKWIAGALFACALVLVLGLCGILIARIWFPAGSLFVFVPGEVFGLFDPQTGLGRYWVAHAFLVLKACSVLGVAFMFSCANMKPAAATILALSFVFVSRILQEIPYFRDFQHWFITYHLNLWQWMFSDSIPWPRVGESLSMLVGFNLTFFVIGAAIFHLRDIKS